MRVVGLDYASRNYSGLAVAEDGAPVSASAFMPKAKAGWSDPEMLVEYERWLIFKLKLLVPDVVIVEELAVFQNKKTIRALAHRECVCLLAAKKKCGIVIHKPVRSARSVVFNNGGISKDDAWKTRAKHIDFDFGRKDAGGTDKMDAMTLAMAAPTLLERA